MPRLLFLVALALSAIFTIAGCGKIDGPRFWWDDRNQTRLPDSYQLPADPGAPAEVPAGPMAGSGQPSSPVGSDLSEDNLRDYRTNLDTEEEKRKSDASLVDF